MYDLINFDGSVFNNKFGLVNLKINRTINNLDELAVWLESLSHELGVICLTETLLHDTSLPIVIPGYKTYNFPLTRCIGGGICFFVKSDTVCSVLTLIHDVFVSFEYAALIALISFEEL